SGRASRHVWRVEEAASRAEAKVERGYGRVLGGDQGGSGQCQGACWREPPGHIEGCREDCSGCRRRDDGSTQSGRSLWPSNAHSQANRTSSTPLTVPLARISSLCSRTSLSTSRARG